MIEIVDNRDRYSNYYYRVNSTYELYYNPLDSDDPDITRAREILYDKLKNIVPEKYEKFSSSLSMTQLRDTLNYLLTFSAFFRSQEGLPMAEYVDATEVKEAAEKEIEEFFKSIDCEYKKVSIKYFNT
jgi:hypothetical protein